MNLEKGSYQCMNSACKRVFDKPLRALNLRCKNRQPYEACPFCLSPIALPVVETAIETANIMEDKPTVPPVSTDKSPGCSRHFKYLSERSQKDGIPDECLTCKAVIECMQKV